MSVTRSRQTFDTLENAIAASLLSVTHRSKAPLNVLIDTMNPVQEEEETADVVGPLLQCVGQAVAADNGL